MVGGMNRTSGPSPLDPWLSLTGECVERLEEIPVYCQRPPSTNDRPDTEYFTKCVGPMKAAAECIDSKAQLRCPPARRNWLLELPNYFMPYYGLSVKVNEQLKGLNPASATNIAQAIRDVYFISIAHCDPKLIQRVATFLETAIKVGEFGKIVDYISKTGIDKLTGRFGVGFSNKFATLLLVRTFMAEAGVDPEKCDQKCGQKFLDRAFQYFPPAPARHQ